MGAGKMSAALDLRWCRLGGSASDVIPNPTELSSTSSVTSAISSLLTCAAALGTVGLFAQLARLPSVQTEVCVDAELREE